MLKKIVVALVGMLLLGSVVACSSPASESSSSGAGSQSEAPAANTVIVDGMRFTPAVLTIKAGETVTWKFQDEGIGHNVVSVVTNIYQDKELDSGTPQMRGEYQHTFAEAGVYDYNCEPHPDMTGQIIVE